MSNKIRLSSLFLTLLLVGGLTWVSAKVGSQSPFSGNLKKVTYALPLEQLDPNTSLHTLTDFISGEITVFPLKSEANGLEFNALYKVREVRPLVQAAGNFFSVRLKPSGKWGFSSRSYWNIGLNPSLRHSLDIRSQTSRQTLDLSGIPLEALTCTAEAGKVAIRFDRPNPIEMTCLNITTKASECHLVGLNNARIKTCTLEGKTGYYILDFSGQQTTSCNMTLTGSLGKTTLIFPSHLNAKILLKDSHIHLSHKHLVKHSKEEYVTAEFNPNAPLLTLVVHLGVGRFIISD